MAIPSQPTITVSTVRTHPRWRLIRAAVIVGAGLLGSASAPAQAERIENATAVFAALDKVTARISKLEIKLGQTIQFGALKVTPRACYSRQPTEPPKTSTFVEIDEILLDGKESRIFSGWMFAESPGLNAVEHPVFDVWLTTCTQPRTTTSQSPSQRPVAGSTGDTGSGATPPRFRPKR